MNDKYIGKTFGRITILSFSRRTKTRCGKYLKYDRYFIGECACGTVREFSLSYMARGNTKSCGCRAKEMHKTLPERSPTRTHGASNTPTYRSWLNMKSRVKPYRKDRKNYYDKGIMVCERWLHSFENFLEDMGTRPEGLTLDRINGDKNYEPGNCRWADDITQARNKKIWKRYDYKGKKYMVTELAELSGIDKNRLWDRIHNQGMSAEQAIASGQRLKRAYIDGRWTTLPTHTKRN